MPTGEAEQRAAVAAAARAWIGTPFHFNAQSRGVGVSCSGLLIGAFSDAGVFPSFDPGHFPRDYHLNCPEGDDFYLRFVRRFGREIPGRPDVGDVMLFHYGRAYAHGAIVVEAEPLTIVHAFFRARRVVEERLTVRSDLLQHQKRGSPGPMIFTHWP